MELWPRSVAESRSVLRIWTRGNSGNDYIRAGCESISMICKLIESANHPCMLFACMEYKDALPEESFDTARENSSVKVRIVLAPRCEVSNATELRADTPAEGNPMLKEKKRN